MMRALRWLLLVLVAVAPRSAAIAAAQIAAETPGPTRREIGPLALTPTLGLTFGTDSNVFNESERPREDVTATFRPQLDARLRLGRGRVSGRAAFDFVYFREFPRERSINSDAAVGFEMPLHRFRPSIGATFLDTRQRASFEIDVRARRVEQALQGGLDVRLTPRTSVALAAHHTHIRFRGGTSPVERQLREALNRDVAQVSASVRVALTPLTTAVLATSVQQDRFAFVPSRDASSVRVTPGIEFSTFALITGKAFFGYCTFETGSGGAPSFTGTVASIDLGTTLRDATRLSVRADRDVVFSFDVRTPYYLLTGLSGSVTHRISPSWDVFVRVGKQFYAYRTIDRTLPDPSGRRLTALQYGGGFGYRIGRTVRLGLNVDYFRRDAEILTLRDTNGVRLTNSITYGS